MKPPEKTPNQRSLHRNQPDNLNRESPNSRDSAESTPSYSEQMATMGEDEKRSELGAAEESRTWTDESMEFSTKLAEFSARLATGSPAPASLDPAVTFYRAGYAAALAKCVRPLKRGISTKSGVSKTGIPAKSCTPTLQLVASWILIVALAGPAGYFWGHRQGTATLANAQREFENELATQLPVAQLSRPEETTEPRPLTRHDDEATDSGNSDGLAPAGPKPGVAVPNTPGVPQAPIPSVAPTLADNSPAAADDTSWSRVRSWLGLGETAPVAQSLISWSGFHVNPRARAEWVERLTAQIHDPSADTLGSTPHDLSTSGSHVRPKSSASNGSPRSTGWSDRVTPTSSRSILEKRSQLMDALLQ